MMNLAVKVSWSILIDYLLEIIRKHLKLYVLLLFGYCLILMLYFQKTKKNLLRFTIFCFAKVVANLYEHLFKNFKVFLELLINNFNTIAEIIFEFFLLFLRFNQLQKGVVSICQSCDKIFDVHTFAKGQLLFNSMEQFTVVK